MSELILDSFDKISNMTHDLQFFDVINQLKMFQAYVAREFAPAPAFEAKDWHNIVVAKQDGRAVGFIVWTRLREKIAFVGLSWVDPQYRKRGIYKAMLKRVDSEAKHRFGCERIQLAVAGKNDLSIAVHNAIFGIPEMIVYSKPTTI